MPEEIEILDADEVAQMLKIHPRTVKRLANQRVIRGFQVAGKWRFRRIDIEEFINKQLEQQPDKKDE